MTVWSIDLRTPLPRSIDHDGNVTEDFVDDYDNQGQFNCIEVINILGKHDPVTWTLIKIRHDRDYLSGPVARKSSYL